jgi:Ras-related protein Rab-7A
VGKTSVVRRFTQDKFEKQYRSTIGADNVMKEVDQPTCIALLSIWDTGIRIVSAPPCSSSSHLAFPEGVELDTLGMAFYRGVDVCLLLYDVSKPATLHSLSRWKHLISQAASSPVPFVVFGNKVIHFATVLAIPSNTKGRRTLQQMLGE